MLHGLLWLVCIVACAPAYGATANCPVAFANDQLRSEIIERQGRRAAIVKQLFSELRSISEEAKDASKPVGEQLPRQDLTRWGEITAQLLPLQFAALIDGRRDRDLTVVDQMLAEARKSYTDPTRVTQVQQKIGELWKISGGTLAGLLEHTERVDVPATVLALMRGIVPESPISVEPRLLTECTVNNAIAQEELEISARFRSFDSAVGKALPLQEVRLVQDLDNIRGWWLASDQIYQTSREALDTYGADPTRIGNALDESFNSSDKKRHILKFLWDEINIRLPSPESQTTEMTNCSKRQGAEQGQCLSRALSKSR
jgi:hypothetical protein